LVADLRSVKMPAADRARACALHAASRWSVEQVGAGWGLVRRYRRQLEELHAARERARETNGRRKLGLTRGAVEERQAQRVREAEAARTDLGL
jgi:hypothetical protein